MSDTKVIGFYGFKGGAGRSLLLANLAYALGVLGERVLVMDCDLEAPGLGDYFDWGGHDISSAWESKLGIMDLIRGEIQPNLAGLNAQELGSALFDDATGLLSRSEGAWVTEVALPKRPDGPCGSVKILGPGSHKMGKNQSREYFSKLVDFDWNGFMARKGIEFLSEMGEALKRHNRAYDYVLFDARTGYSLASVILLQNWATDVVSVGTTSFQSINGLSRVMPVFQAAGLRCHLVISRVHPNWLTGEMEGERFAKTKIIEAYHPYLELKRRVKDSGVSRGPLNSSAGAERSLYWLPHVEDLMHGDSFLWGRGELREQLSSGTNPVKQYFTEFSDMLKTLTDIDLPLLPQSEVARQNTVSGIFEALDESLTVVFALGNRSAIKEDIQKRTDSLLGRLQLRLQPNETPSLPALSPVGSSPVVKNDGRARASSEAPEPSLDDTDIVRMPIWGRQYARLRFAQYLNSLEQGSDDSEATPLRTTIAELAQKELSLLPVERESLPKMESEVAARDGGAIQRDETELESLRKAMFGPIETLPESSAGEGSPIKRLEKAVGRSRREGGTITELGCELLEHFRAEQRPVELATALLEAVAFLGRRVTESDNPLSQQPARKAIEEISSAIFCRLPVLAQEAPRNTEEATYRWAHFLDAVFIMIRSLRQYVEDVALPPHSLTAVLSANDGDSIVTALNYQGAESVPAGAYIQSRMDSVSNLAVLKCLCLSGRAGDAATRFQELCETLLDARYPHSSTPEWTYFLSDVASMAGTFGDRGGARLSRLVARNQWSRSEVQRASSASSVAVALSRHGVYFKDATHTRIEELSTNSREWHRGAEMVLRGEYQEADAKLRSAANSDPVEHPNIFRWAHESRRSLGDENGLHELYIRWRQMVVGRMGPVEDYEAAWLTCARGESRVLVVNQKQSKAKALLDQCLAVVNARTLPRAVEWQFAIRVGGARVLLQMLPAEERASAAKDCAKDLKGRLFSYKKSVAANAALGGDRAFAKYLHEDWTEQGLGEGMFAGNEAPAPARLALAELLVEYAEILLYAGKTPELKRTCVDVEKHVLDGYDESNNSAFLRRNRLAYCYSIAAASALRYAVEIEENERQKLIDRAKRHRDADLSANGAGRDKYYQQIFDICKMNLPPFVPMSS